MDPRLLGRQMRLAEVGERGQSRIAAAHAAPPPGPSRAIAIEYMRRAGIGRVDDDGARAPYDLEALGLRHPAAREVGEGALAALAAVNLALAGGAE